MNKETITQTLIIPPLIGGVVRVAPQSSDRRYIGFFSAGIGGTQYLSLDPHVSNNNGIAMVGAGSGFTQLAFNDEYHGELVQQEWWMFTASLPPNPCLVVIERLVTEIAEGSRQRSVFVPGSDGTPGHVPEGNHESVDLLRLMQKARQSWGR